MDVQQMAPQEQKPKRLSVLWMHVSTTFIALLALLWRLIVWMWGFLIIGSVAGVLGNAFFTLLTTGKIDLTGTLMVLTWLYAHIFLCISILTLTLVITLCSYLAHRWGQRVTQESQRTHNEALVVVAKGVQRALDELNTKPPAIQTSLPPPLSTHEDTIPPKAIWNIPYRRNPFFTRREDLLKQLHNQLTANKTAALTQAQAISGLGGVGKTQIAMEYAYRYGDEYRFVMWVRAATQTTLITDFVALARLLQLPEHEEQDQEKVATAVKHWLSNHTGWLLILDNADDPATILSFLPISSTGHILLTTRAQAVGPLANSIEVEKMEQDEGTLLLLRRAKVIATDASLDQASEDDRLKAEAIMIEMDGLPLALDQAGAYIEETGCTISAYLDHYRQRQVDLLNRRGGLGIDHPEPVTTTWSLSFELVELANPVAADLLRFCAFLSPDAIPEEMVVKSAPELGSRLQRIATDPLLLDEALGILRRFSLVRRNSNDKTFSLHRLVQAVLKTSMNKRAQLRWAERTVRAINRVFLEVSTANWSQSQRYLSYIQTCVDLINQNALAFPGVVQLLDPPEWFRRGYRYVRAEYLYIIHEDDPKHHSQAVTIEIEAFQLGISSFLGKYSWSGQGEKEALRAISPGQTLVGEIIETDRWKYYLIHLGHELSEGERAEVKFIQDLYDSENKFEPYIAKTVSEPMDCLTFRVRLPRSNLPSVINFSEVNILEPTSPLTRTIPGMINHESGEILWVIQNPSYGHRYEIHWDE